MKKYYEEAIQKICEMSKILTESEWNKIAKEENYLSSESLRYISNIDFEDWCKTIINSNA